LDEKNCLHELFWKCEGVFASFLYVSMNWMNWQGIFDSYGMKDSKHSSLNQLLNSSKHLSKSNTQCQKTHQKKHSNLKQKDNRKVFFSLSRCWCRYQVKILIDCFIHSKEKYIEKHNSKVFSFFFSHCQISHWGNLISFSQTWLEFSLWMINFLKRKLFMAQGFLGFFFLSWY
jgi:hypothetical protein